MNRKYQFLIAALVLALLLAGCQGPTSGFGQDEQLQSSKWQFDYTDGSYDTWQFDAWGSGERKLYDSSDNLSAELVFTWATSGSILRITQLGGSTNDFPYSVSGTAPNRNIMIDNVPGDEIPYL